MTANKKPWERLAREWVRHARGRRSQVALSRRLGYRTNALYAWEAGRDFPTAARFFHLLERTGVDVRAGLVTFYRSEPDWLSEFPPSSRAGVAAMLSHLRGSTPIVALAERTGLSRFAVARMLSGKTEPRLPHFLALLEAASYRCLDLVAALGDPAALPSVAQAHAELVAVREAAHSAPWSQAVMRCLEHAAYRSMRQHESGWIAAQLGISLEEEATCLSLLEASGQIQLRDGRYHVERVLMLDTRRDRASTRALRRFWTSEALRRIDLDPEDAIFSYNVFGVSCADYERLRELQLEYYHRMREIVANSEPVERVAVIANQLVPLDAAPKADPERQRG